jgi:hypothetical protein
MILAKIDIPTMPPVDLSATVATLVILGLLAVGAVLIWRGLRYSRGIMAIAGGLIGWALVDPVALKFGEDIPLIAIYPTLILTGAVLGFVLTRLAGAAITAALAGGATLYVIVTHNTANLSPAPKFKAAEAGDALRWIREVGRLGRDYVEAMTRKALNLSADVNLKDISIDPDAGASLGVLAGVLLVSLFLAMFMRRVCLILLTSVLGSCLFVAAWAVGAKLVGHTENPATIVGDRMVLPALAGLTLVGVLVQSLALHKSKDDIPTAKPAE